MQIDRGIDAVREAFWSVEITFRVWSHCGFADDSAVARLVTTVVSSEDTDHVTRLIYAVAFAVRYNEKDLAKLAKQQLQLVSLDMIVDQCDSTACALNGVAELVSNARREDALRSMLTRSISSEASFLVQ